MGSEMCIRDSLWVGVAATFLIPLNLRSIGFNEVKEKSKELALPPSFDPLNWHVFIQSKPVFRNNVRQVQTTTEPVKAPDLDGVNIDSLRVLGVIRVNNKWQANVLYDDLESPVWVFSGDEIGAWIVKDISERDISLNDGTQSKIFSIYDKSLNDQLAPGDQKTFSEVSGN